MLEGVFPCVGDVGGDAVLVPDVLELYFDDEEEDDQEDRGTQGEAQGQPHCCGSGTAAGEGMRGCAGQDDCGDICVLDYLISFHLIYFKVQLAGSLLCEVKADNVDGMPRNIRLEAVAQPRDSTQGPTSYLKTSA